LGAVKVTQSEDICGICKCKGIVIAPRDIGHFTKEQIAQARAEAKKLGIKGQDGLDPKTVEKALTIVEGVLGEGMSLWTRKVHSGIKEDFERGKQITKYDLEKLMFWFAQDVEMRGHSDDGREGTILTDGNGQPLRREGGPVEGKKRVLLIGG
jgi:hypothetical protein